MDVVHAIEGEARRCAGRLLPLVWRADERFVGLATVRDVISAIRDCDARSDGVLRALIEFGPSDSAASVVVVAALLRYRAGRCGGIGERVDALAGELAIVLGEAWRGELPLSSRRLANVMTDRAWGRVRAAERKGRWLRVVDLDALAAWHADGTPSPEDAVLDAVAVGDFRRMLGSLPDPRVARAWDTAAELACRDRRSEAERSRWRYARDMVRRHVTEELELIDAV